MKKRLLLIMVVLLVIETTCFAKNNEMYEENVQYIHDVSTRIHI